jgi:hypothetical protein
MAEAFSPLGPPRTWITASCSHALGLTATNEGTGKCASL